LNTAPVEVGDLKLPQGGGALHGPARDARLSQQEERVMRLLMKNANRITHKDTLVSVIWAGRADGPLPNIVNVVVCRLRAKLRDIKSTTSIETRWGYGYMLTTKEARNDLVVRDIEEIRA
jgi:DNA-binding response OmpR family regulator